MATIKTELLAPAGSFDAACAAFQYGADAIYLGLGGLSARAEAVNFSPDQLASIVAYAHSLTPRRSVYLAINTLIHNDELNGAIEALTIASNAQVDGVIIQDFAVYSLAHRLFPNLTLHASTQMCVHNKEGAIALKELGFSRVVFSRELSYDEIADIASTVDIETEVFIHGALCYGYSGLCLFSALTTGRSGNRGKCAYCCRGSFSSPEKSQSSFPFSMRDLALRDGAIRLRDAGVTSLKIEGRMKSPLYVAAATHLYRLILDGKASQEEIEDAAQDLQTVFSRPTTTLYFNGRNASSESIIDSETVGHRGTLIGRVESVNRDRNGRFLRFTTARDIEVHDGIQVDMPGRPYGFPVDILRRAGELRSSISCPSGSRIEIALPQDAPKLPIGAKVFCSSSQGVHRKFAFSHPRKTEMLTQLEIEVEVTLNPNSITATSSLNGQIISLSVEGTLTKATKPEATRPAIEKAFSRTGESHWKTSKISIVDPLSLYAPASLLNELRRRLCQALDECFEIDQAKKTQERLDYLNKKLEEPIPNDDAIPLGHSCKVRLSSNPTKIDANEVVLALTTQDATNLDQLTQRLTEWQQSNDKIRISLPTLLRGNEAAITYRAIEHLDNLGYKAWECTDLATLHALKRICKNDITITADNSFYALNKIAAQQLRELGIAAVVAPVEIDDDKLEELQKTLPSMIIVPIKSRPPLFISETRPITPWTKSTNYELTDRHGNCYTVEKYDNRWYTRLKTATEHLLPKGALRTRTDLTDRQNP